MKTDIQIQAVDPLTVSTDVLVVAAFKGGIEGPGAAAVLEGLGLEGVPITPEFRGDIGQHLRLSAPGLPFASVLFVGLGRMDAVDPERLRRAAGVAARAVDGVRSVATTLVQVHPTEAAVAAVAEGFLLGGYRDDRHKTKEQAEPRVERLVILATSALQQGARKALRRAEIYAAATCHARDLVNEPPDRKRPGDLAATIRHLVGDVCEVSVHEESALRAQGYGGILAVGQASSQPPCLVELRYRPPEPLGHVVLAGKGITFDTGGLSLKRGTAMAGMKSDMAGAAVVAAACASLAELGVRTSVTALLPLAENSIGGNAQRPGDIVRMHGGATVEVLDTDAEGRLVLADVLDAGAAMAPDAMVDVATLTGSAVTALGAYCAALMANDRQLAAGLRRAADLVGESVWELPLSEELDRFLDSPVADCNNTGDGPGGGSITAALFLQRFTGDIPWAHLDIAGPAFLEEPLARDYLPTGATGFGVRTLLAWLEARAG